MSFKSQIQKDLDTFINGCEFADIHNLNGTSCTAVVQDVTINENLYPTYGRDSYREGVFAFGRVINVKKSDLPKVPFVGMVFLLDNQRGQVVNVADDEGILTITWTANAL